MADVTFIPNPLLGVQWEASITARAIVMLKGESVRDTAQRLAPRDTGRLASSITVEFEAHDGHPGSVITADTPYAVYVELGTYDTPAQPFLRPALEGGE